MLDFELSWNERVVAVFREASALGDIVKLRDGVVVDEDFLVSAQAGEALGTLQVARFDERRRCIARFSWLDCRIRDLDIVIALGGETRVEVEQIVVEHQTNAVLSSAH